MNVIEREEFELVYFETAVNHYATGTRHNKIITKNSLLASHLSLEYWFKSECHWTGGNSNWLTSKPQSKYCATGTRHNKIIRKNSLLSSVNVKLSLNDVYPTTPASHCQWVRSYQYTSIQRSGDRLSYIFIKKLHKHINGRIHINIKSVLTTRNLITEVTVDEFDSFCVSDFREHEWLNISNMYKGVFVDVSLSKEIWSVDYLDVPCLVLIQVWLNLWNIQRY